MKLAQLGDGHDGAVWDCAISWNGSFFVSASRDTTLKLWDPETGRDVTMLRGHDDEVGACAVAPNGRFVVSGGDDGRVMLWALGGITPPPDVKLAEGRPDLILGNVTEMRGHAGPVLGCAISPDARLIVSSGEDQTIKLWEPHTGRELATLRGHEAPVLDCAVSASGKNIVSASADCTVRLWDIARGETQATLRGHSEIVTSCAMSPDLRFVASAGVDGNVVLFDTAEQALTVLGSHDGPVLACAFSPDGAFVASAGADTTLRLWSLQTRDEMAAIALTSGLQCVALHPTRPLAVCGDHAGAVHLIDLSGVEYGPLTVTAVEAADRPGEPVLLCPRCGTLLPDAGQLLGTLTTCPGRRCRTELSVNPFLASTPVPKSSEDFDSGPFVAQPPREAPTPPTRRRWFRKQ